MPEQNLDIVVRIRGGQVVSQEVKQIGKSVESVGTSAEKSSKKTTGFNKALVGLATGFLAYKGAAYLKGAVKYTGDLSKASLGLQRITGMDIQKSAGWIGVAKERGTASKQLNQSFITLSKQVVAATDASSKQNAKLQDLRKTHSALGVEMSKVTGHGKKQEAELKKLHAAADKVQLRMAKVGTTSASAQKAFAQLGISSKELGKMKTSEIIDRTADAFKKMPNGATKAALAQRLFGRQAQAMLPLLNGGSKALNEQTGAMGKSLNMTKDGAKSAMELVKAQREWGRTQDQLKVATATALLPVILQLTQALMPLIQMFANLMTHSKLFSSVVLALTAALVVMVATIWLANAGLFTLNAQVLLIPAIIAGVIVGLILLYQKCAWFRGAVQAAMHAVVSAFNWVKQAAVDVFNWVKGHWPLLVGLIGGPLALAVAEAVKHFGSIKQAAVDAFNKIKSVIGTVSSFISSTLGGAFNGVKGAVQGVVDTIQTMIDTAQKIESLPAKALKALNPFGQHGLYMSTGGTAVVGEAGPEMVRLPQGAQVMPFMQGRGGSGGGGGQVVVPVYLDKRQIALAMGSYTADEQAAR